MLYNRTHPQIEHPDVLTKVKLYRTKLKSPEHLPESSTTSVQKTLVPVQNNYSNHHCHACMGSKYKQTRFGAGTEKLRLCLGMQQLLVGLGKRVLERGWAEAWPSTTKDVLFSHVCIDTEPPGEHGPGQEAPQQLCVAKPQLCARDGGASRTSVAKSAMEGPASSSSGLRDGAQELLPAHT